MKILRLFFGMVMCLNFIHAAAQDERTLEYIRQEEQRRRAEVMRHLDSGVYYMENEQYLLADQKFRYVLDNVKSVPSDLTFFFGKNSFYLNRFKQSIDWLNKYIQLKGTSGQYHEEAIDFLKKSEQAFVLEKSAEAQKTQEVLSANYDIDCGPADKVSCPVCKGDHVITRRGAFGDEYRTCPYCNEHGMLTCDEYNKLLRGQLKKRL